MSQNLKSRALLFGLLIGCPFNEPDPECPLGGLRSEDLHEMKQMAFDQIEEHEVDFILSYHHTCCTGRDGAMERSSS